jgi:hypothetical protein
MDYTPYLPRSGEDESEYYHRVWLSDLWDKVSTMEYQGIPNNAIQTVIVMKRFVFSRNCQELVSLMKTFEDRVLERKTDLLFCEWAKVYCRRIYRRKNTAFRTAPPVKKEVVSSPPPPPKTNPGIAFSGKRI